MLGSKLRLPPKIDDMYTDWLSMWLLTQTSSKRQCAGTSTTHILLPFTWPLRLYQSFFKRKNRYKQNKTNFPGLASSEVKFAHAKISEFLLVYSGEPTCFPYTCCFTYGLGESNKKKIVETECLCYILVQATVSTNSIATTPNEMTKTYGILR